MVRKSVFVAGILALAMSVSPCFCAKKMSLVERGLSLASLMSEKAGCEEYVKIFIGSKSELMEEYIKEIASADVSKPTAVYKISGDFSAFAGVFRPLFGWSDEISPRIKKELADSVFSSLPKIWTSSKANAAGIAAVSLLASSAVFVSRELDENCVYVYTFPNAYPVSVSFVRGDDNAVFASAAFVLDRDFPESLGKMLGVAKENGASPGIRLDKIK